MLVRPMVPDYGPAIMTRFVYKVCGWLEWQAAQRSGTYEGSPDDVRDGFIHLSTASQLDGTVAKHFAGQSDLVLITLETKVLGDQLKWEKSRKGELFPHLYGVLAVGGTETVSELPTGNTGSILPDLEEIP